MHSMIVLEPPPVDPVGEPEQQPSAAQEAGQLQGVRDDRVGHAAIERLRTGRLLGP
jgi:hypothetical protein